MGQRDGTTTTTTTSPRAASGQATTTDVKGKRFAVLGLARSGIGCARLLLTRGANVTVLDLKPRHQLPPGIDELERLGARVVLGPHPADELVEVDTIVISPGVPDLPQVFTAQQAGVKVVAEIEVALWFLRAPLVAVTGTNGKSTVTTLLGEMARRAGRPSFAGANLGTPLTDAVDSPANSPEGLIVAELSSFQFERTFSLHPRVAVLLNVTDDHLDRHKTFEAYAALKGRVFAGQTEVDDAIVPAGDPVCERLAAQGKARILRFGCAGDARLDGNDMVVQLPGRPEVRISRAVLRIRGEHNVDNALAAALAATCLDLPATAIVATLATFEGLPHRMQLVGEVRGVAYYDDSKATNVGAALRAIDGLDRQGVLIAGGREKGGSYAPLRDAVRRKIKRIILIGEARPAMKAQLGDLVPCYEARSLEAAVAMAAEATRPGEAVLLAPACSSYDMFRDYQERGDRFAAAVRSLAALGGDHDAPSLVPAQSRPSTRPAPAAPPRRKASARSRPKAKGQRPRAAPAPRASASGRKKKGKKRGG